MKTINLYKLSEKVPEDNQEILFVRVNEFYSSYDFEFGTVEYSYEELDEDGNFTGNSYFGSIPKVGDEDYDEKFKFKLYYCINGSSLSENDLWVPAKKIDEELFGD